MSPSPDPFNQPLPPAGSPGARDRGLRRSRRLTRWIAVTSVAGAAALGGGYAHLLPGSPAASAPTQSSVPGASSATSGDDDQGSHEDGEEGDQGGAPQPPAQPPTAAQQQPHTTTGAS